MSDTTNDDTKTPTPRKPGFWKRLGAGLATAVGEALGEYLFGGHR